MSRGIRKRWERGTRNTVEAKDQRGHLITLRGKHGGAVIKQTVVLVLEPKAVRS